MVVLPLLRKYTCHGFLIVWLSSFFFLSVVKPVLESMNLFTTTVRKVFVLFHFCYPITAHLADGALAPLLAQLIQLFSPNSWLKFRYFGRYTHQTVEPSYLLAVSISCCVCSCPSWQHVISTGGTRILNVHLCVAWKFRPQSLITHEICHFLFFGHWITQTEGLMSQTWQVSIYFEFCCSLFCLNGPWSFFLMNVGHLIACVYYVYYQLWKKKCVEWTVRFSAVLL